ncbi:MAG: SDR family NAD(P)-dependent oxidoreductase, partial [Spartobacteria bacterium]
MNPSTLPLASATNPFDLSGRRAIVTGSSRGIGAAIAIALAEAGAEVAINHESELASDSGAKYEPTKKARQPDAKGEAQYLRFPACVSFCARIPGVKP